jgi:hypothetical protein
LAARPVGDAPSALGTQFPPRRPPAARPEVRSARLLAGAESDQPSAARRRYAAWWSSASRDSRAWLHTALLPQRRASTALVPQGQHFVFVGALLSLASAAQPSRLAGQASDFASVDRVRELHQRFELKETSTRRIKVGSAISPDLPRSDADCWILAPRRRSQAPGFG